MAFTATTYRRRGLGILVVFVTALATACEIPVLESTQCNEARGHLKRFYSLHFGDDMLPTAENLAVRRAFLTERLYEDLANAPVGSTDYFTQSDDYPRTFKIGKCNHFPDASNLTMQVQVYWRDDQQVVQKEVSVDVHQRDNIHGMPAWLIDKVY